MTLAEYTTAVKRRLDIEVAATEFDDEIGDFIEQSVKRLYPLTAQEVDPEIVSVTIDSYGEGEVSFTTESLDDVRLVEAYDGSSWFPVDGVYRHGSKLRVRGLSTDVSQLKLYGLLAYDVETVPGFLELPVIWYSMSEFYDMLAGNKRKYNVYMQNGGAALDDMRQESDYYEAKAQRYIEEHATAYGSQ